MAAAALVALPCAAAAVAALLSTRAWGEREAGAVTVLLVAGVASTGALAALTAEEKAGARWRGATIRDELTATLPGWGGTTAVYRSLAGAPLVRVQTLYLGARHGYRVGLLAGLTAATGVAYAVLCLVAIFVIVTRGSWRQRTD